MSPDVSVTVTAVDDLSMIVPEGSITVLLGPNGAGKTTTVRLTTGALGTNGGTVRVLGMDPGVDGDLVRARTAVVPPKPALYDQLTGWENLALTADIFDADHSAIALLPQVLASTTHSTSTSVAIRPECAPVSLWPVQYFTIRRYSFSTSRRPVSTLSLQGRCST